MLQFLIAIHDSRLTTENVILSERPFFGRESKDPYPSVTQLSFRAARGSPATERVRGIYVFDGTHICIPARDSTRDYPARDSGHPRTLRLSAIFWSHFGP